MKKILIFPVALFAIGTASAQMTNGSVTPTGAPGTSTTINNNTSTVRPVPSASQNSEMRRQSPPPPGTIQQNPHGNAMSPATGVNTLESNTNATPASTSQSTTNYRNTNSTLPAANTTNQGGYNAAPGTTATNRTGGRK